MSQVTQHPEPRTGRSVPLIISVCLNIALIAMIAAALASSAFHHHRSRWMQGPLGLSAMMEVAKPDERQRIEATMEAHRDRLRALAKDAADGRAAAFRVFAQPSFNRAEYEKTLDRVRTTNDSLQIEVSAMMAEAASQLSPQERQELAEHARRSFWHSWRHSRFWW